MTRPDPNTALPPPPTALPLRTLHLPSAPLATHAITWSPDAELAIASDDAISVFLPTFPNPSSVSVDPNSSSSATGNSQVDNAGLPTAPAGMLPSTYAQPGQFFSHRMRWPVTRPPDPSMNAALCAAAGVRISRTKSSMPRSNDANDNDNDNDTNDNDNDNDNDSNNDNYNDANDNMTDSDGAQQRGATAPEPICGEPCDRWWECGAGLVTGSGAAMSQVVALAWSPSKLGHNMRPVLAVLLTTGALMVYGEHSSGDRDGRQSLGLGLRVRTFRSWGTLWGLGARLPLVDRSKDEGYRLCDDRVTAFAWAGELGRGSALLAYRTGHDEVVVVAVGYAHPEGNGCQWRVEEEGRFQVLEPHGKGDVYDPDHVPFESSFCLKWSPWLAAGDRKTALLSYITRNHVGFRRITTRAVWDHASPRETKIEDTDTQGICVCLSADAFVEWEDAIAAADGEKKICRGLIATPFAVRAFQVDMSASASLAMDAHHVSSCGTAYPTDVSAEDMLNPITGLYVHPFNAKAQSAAPSYSLARLSATATNHNWYQDTTRHHGRREDEPRDGGEGAVASAAPQWAEYIRRMTQIQVPISVALAGGASAAVGDEDSGESDAEGEPAEDAEHDQEAVVDDESDVDERGEFDGAGTQVYPYRIRIWGLAASPGAGTSVILASQHSTQRPERVCRMLVMFGWREHGEERPSANEHHPAHDGMSTEGRVWEWMYGGGPPVPMALLGGNDTRGAGRPGSAPALAESFRDIHASQRCSYCQTALRATGLQSRCANNHAFETCAASGLAILAPGISRICGVCGRRTLVMPVLRWLLREQAADHGLDVLDEVVRVCGGCGGKFVV